MEKQDWIHQGVQFFSIDGVNRWLMKHRSEISIENFSVSPFGEKIVYVVWFKVQSLYLKQPHQEALKKMIDDAKTLDKSIN